MLLCIMPQNTTEALYLNWAQSCHDGFQALQRTNAAFQHDSCRATAVKFIPEAVGPRMAGGADGFTGATGAGTAEVVSIVRT